MPSEVPIEGDLSQEHSSLLSPLVLEPREAPPVRFSDATRQTIGARDPEVLVEDERGREPQPERDIGVNGSFPHHDTAGESASARVRLPVRREAIARALSGIVSTDAPAPPAERQEDSAPVPSSSVSSRWVWKYADIPAVSTIRYGPVSSSMLAGLLDIEETVSMMIDQ